MALIANNLVATLRRRPTLRMAAEHAQPVPFAAVALGPFIKVGSPVYRDELASNNWKIWTTGEAIEGFLYFQGEGTRKVQVNTTPTPDEVEEGIKLDATSEVHGVVMSHGMIHRDDVPLPAGETQPNLDAALNALQGSNLYIQGATG